MFYYCLDHLDLQTSNNAVPIDQQSHVYFSAISIFVQFVCSRAPPFCFDKSIHVVNGMGGEGDIDTSDSPHYNVVFEVDDIELHRMTRYVQCVRCVAVFPAREN